MLQVPANYARVIAERFSDRVKNFFTINEPQCFVGLSFSEGVHAPWLQLPDSQTLLMSHNALKAHGRAVQELRAHARQPLNIGYAPTSGIALPATDKPEDIEAARQAYFGIPQEGTWAWNTAWWSDPVIFGKYPEEFLVHFEKDLPKITDDDMKIISEPIDIYGQNIYLGYPVRMGEDGKPELLSRNTGYAKSASNWPMTPDALYWGPKFLYDRYTGDRSSCMTAIRSRSSSQRTDLRATTGSTWTERFMTRAVSTLRQDISELCPVRRRRRISAVTLHGL